MLNRSAYRNREESGVSSTSVKAFLFAAMIVILVSAVGLFAPRMIDRLLLLQIAAVFAGGFMLFLFNFPSAGLVLVIGGGLLVSQEIGTGTQAGLNVAVLMSPVMILWWVLYVLFGGRDRYRVKSLPIKPLYFFMATVVLALIVGQYPWFPAEHASMSAQLAQTAVFLFSGGLFLVSAHLLQNIRWMKIVTFSFIGMASIHLVVRLVPGAAGALERFLPIAVSQGSMFWAWLVAMSFGQALLNRELGIVGRLAMLGVAATSVGIGLTQLNTWVSGWAPMLMAVGLILFLRFPLPVLMLAPALGVIAFVGANVLTDLATAGDNLYSAETRAAAFKSLLPLLSANPLLGLGPANYYHYTLLYPILGWYVKFNSHNNYLDLIAQTGFIGLGGFLWFMTTVGIVGWRLHMRSMSGFERGFVFSAVAGLCASVAAAGLGDWVIPFIYNTGFPGYRTSVLPWIFLGGLIAIEQRLNRTT